MEPEVEPLAMDATPEPAHDDDASARQASGLAVAENPRDPGWFLIGDDGLRAGWSVLLFSILAYVFYFALQILNVTIHPADMDSFSARSALIEKLIEAAAVAGSALLMARLEQRRFDDFNLSGPRRIARFLAGFAAGFAALSLLVGSLWLGGWLHFGPAGLAGVRILLYAGAWGVVFLLTGFAEEGAFRCYLQFTLARGLNFWWALAAVGLLCLRLALGAQGNGVWGVYLMAALGVAPCLYLHLKKTPGSGFWQAAWVTSTLFGYWHTDNNGENWVGIFAAAAIGFVFCVSVRLTGSAWWAIGCHAAWDWAETYFYGTADSGFVARGHLLTARAAGNALWSGGADGPEGSLLVLGVILLLLAALIAVYGRKRTAALPQAAG